MKVKLIGILLILILLSISFSLVEEVNVEAFYSQSDKCIKSWEDFPEITNSYKDKNWWEEDLWSNCWSCDFYVKIKLNIKGKPENVKIEIDSDDGHALFVNGEKLSNTECHAAGPVYKLYDITNKIKEGDNEIRIWCTEARDVIGFFFGEYCKFSLIIDGIEIRRNGKYIFPKISAKAYYNLTDVSEWIKESVDKTRFFQKFFPTGIFKSYEDIDWESNGNFDGNKYVYLVKISLDLPSKPYYTKLEVKSAATHYVWINEKFIGYEVKPPRIWDISDNVREGRNEIWLVCVGFGNAYCKFKLYIDNFIIRNNREVCKVEEESCKSDDECCSGLKCLDGKCQKLVCSGFLSLSFDKYAAFPGQQIIATMKGLSNCQGKTIYLLDANECISQCSSNPSMPPSICFPECAKVIKDKGKVCECTYTTSCSCTFFAPSKEGEYVYFAVVDKNDDGDFGDGGELDSKTLKVIAAQKLSLTISPSQAKPSEEVEAKIIGKDNVYKGKKAYVVNDSCSTISRCIKVCSSETRLPYSDCLYMCLDYYKVCECSISETSCSCKFKAPSIPKTYTYYACVDINNDWLFISDGESANATLEVIKEKFASVSLSLSKYQATPNERISATISIQGFTGSMQGKSAFVLNISSDKINEINNCLSSPKNTFSSCLPPYIVCTCTIDSSGCCSCNFNAPSNPGTYNYTGFVELNDNWKIDSNEYDTKTLEVIGKITNKIKIRIDDTDDDQERNLVIAVNKKLEEKWWEKSEDELKRNYIVRKIDVDDVGKEIEIEVKEDVKTVELSVDSDISYWNFTIIYPEGKEVKCLNINRDRVCPREKILRIKILDNEGDRAARRFIGLGINEELPNRWWVTARSKCKKVYPDSCVIDKDDRCIVIRVKPREIVGSSIECDVKTDIKNLYIATSSLFYNWKVEITLPDGKKYVYEVSRNLIGRIS